MFGRTLLLYLDARHCMCFKLCMFLVAIVCMDYFIAITISVFMFISQSPPPPVLFKTETCVLTRLSNELGLKTTAKYRNDLFILTVYMVVPLNMSNIRGKGYASVCR